MEQGGFEALPPPQPSPVFDGGGMLTEIMNLPWRKPGGDVLDDQIQPSYRLPHKHQLSAVAVNVAAAEEVDYIQMNIYKYNCNIYIYFMQLLLLQ